MELALHEHAWASTSRFSISLMFVYKLGALDVFSREVTPEGNSFPAKLGVMRLVHCNYQPSLIE